MSGASLGEILGEALKGEHVAASNLSPIEAAAFGDIEAQRHLASQAYAIALEVDGLRRLLALSDALCFARLAAAQGEATDIRQVVFLADLIGADLLKNGFVAEGADYAAHALAMCELGANRGDDNLADLLVRSSDMMPAEVHLMARDMLARAREQAN